jgi:anti-anti-sigma factor
MLETDVLRLEGTTALLRLRGELAGGTGRHSLRRSLEEHFLDDGVQVVRVDLSSLSRIDTDGVATLIALRKEALERGKQFFVTGSTGQVREKLGLTGVLDVLRDERAGL